MKDHPSNTDQSGLPGKLEDAAERATEFAHAQAEAVTDKVTRHAEEKVSNAANAASAAASELEQGSVQAAATDQLASQLQEAATLLRNTDFSTAVSKTTSFARENPVLFLGGAALLGFAAARFLKSSDPMSRPSQMTDTDPWTGHVTGSAQAGQKQSAQSAHAANGIREGATS